MKKYDFLLDILIGGLVLLFSFLLAPVLIVMALWYLGHVFRKEVVSKICSYIRQKRQES